MRRNALVRVSSKALIPAIILVALYVQFHGDFGPGGGFQAGILFAAGFILYALVFGTNALLKAIPFSWLRWAMALGVLLYAGVGVFALYSGAEFLNYAALDQAAPAHGQHVGILLVELGVGITVAAVMLVMFLSLARRGR